ncbi:hypothetical protein R1sor_015584 [Riccia sorocarpa]|uniref:Uncharacterized protein n=1 Tax=Riccia sorocarpa TaxID=122646 RepID=A0ABD3HFZ6_9MARC
MQWIDQYTGSKKGTTKRGRQKVYQSEEIKMTTARRTVGSKSCNSRSEVEFRSSKGNSYSNFFSRGLSFSRTFSRRLQSTSVIANLHQWTTSATSSWGARSPHPVISSPMISSPGPTVSQMWYDLSISSNNLKSYNASKVSSMSSAHLKPPLSPSPASGKQKYLFKRVGTHKTMNPKSVSGSSTESGSGTNPSNDDDDNNPNANTSSTMTTSDDSSDDSDGGDEKLESSEYLTVFVGERSCKRVKYVISKHFLRHHLFQVLLKCSEDEVGLDADEKGGLPIVCDPALFVQLVTVVDIEERFRKRKTKEEEDDDELIDSVDPKMSLCLARRSIASSTPVIRIRFDLFLIRSPAKFRKKTLDDARGD